MTTPATNKEERKTMNGKPVIEIESKRIINFKSAFKEKLLCDGATFSTGTSCVYSCTYCYVPAMMARGPHLKGITQKHEDIVLRRKNAIAILLRELTDHKGRSKFLTEEERGKVIYSSPLVDVAANMNLVQETIAACRLILEHTHWDIRLLSKSNMLPAIARELGNYKSAKLRVIYGVSTGTFNDNIGKIIEPDTPLISKRIKSLHYLQDNGFRTFGMVCPSLPMSQYSLFANTAARELRYDRCEHVWAEVINVRGESFKRTIDAFTKQGMGGIAAQIEKVHQDKTEWEAYARNTYEAHAEFAPPDKLRFLQYVNALNAEYWKGKPGVVCL